MTIIDAIHDPQLFKPLFKTLDTWRAWLVVLKALFALPMEENELPLYRQLTGRTTPPLNPVTEAWLICGRRSGKSFIVALIAAFLACFKDYRPFLAPGERGIVMIVACDRRQARIILRYILAFLESVPMLAAMIERQDSESIDLNNRISIQIMTLSHRSIRGWTVVDFIGEESAYWRSEESASPDQEILAAVRPAMATIPTALLICIGSPYRRSGVMYEAHKRHYGKDDSPVLVIQAPTRVMNPSVPQSIIDQAMERDLQAASAEYLAQFRSDVDSFIDSDLIEAAIETGRRERAPQPTLSYLAFTDPSGGAHDAFTLGIAHKDPTTDRLILDLCRGVKPPFDPSSVVTDFATLLKTYRCYSVVGDRYAGEWVRESFSKAGIDYRHSEQSKSEIYLESLPLFTTGQVDLLDAPPLAMQLMQLERRTSRSGKDSVDHPPSGHDDYANAACGALVQVAQQDRHTVQMYNLLTGRPFTERELARRGLIS